MRNVLKRDTALADSFFEENQEALENFISSSGTGKHLTAEGKALIAKAREHFGYARTTIDHDILRALTRQYKAHKNGNK